MSGDEIKELRDEVKEINEKVTRLLTKEEDREKRCDAHQKTIDDLVDFKTRYEAVRTMIITVILVGAAFTAIIWNSTQFSNYRPPASAAGQTK